MQLEGGPIGSLDLYSANPRDWDQAEISAAQAYAAFAAMLLSQGVATQVKGRLAEHSRWRWSTAAASSGPRGC